MSGSFAISQERRPGAMGGVLPHCEIRSARANRRQAGSYAQNRGFARRSDSFEISWERRLGAMGGVLPHCKICSARANHQQAGSYTQR